jgi:hypothetical protein
MKAESVIMNHGTNGWPLYLQMLEWTETGPEELVRAAKQWLELHGNPGKGRAEEPMRLLAGKAIGLFGTNAAPLIPELERLLTGTSRETPEYVIWALGGIDMPEARNVVEAHFERVNPRNMAVSAIGQADVVVEARQNPSTD